MKILIKSAWGSDDPTKAAFAFLHANAFAEAATKSGSAYLEGCIPMKDAVMNLSYPLVGLRYLRQFQKRYNTKSPYTYERLARWPVRSPSLILMEKMLASSPLRISWHWLHGQTRYSVSSELAHPIKVVPANSQ
jgi:hypothetical protein